MSSQSPVVWWYREVNCEVVGMCVEAVPVLGAESVDFLFNRCDLKILSEDRIGHMVHRLSCPGLSLGSVPVFQCWRWKLSPRAVTTNGVGSSIIYRFKGFCNIVGVIMQPTCKRRAKDIQNAKA
jgi:hypothetical protein